MNFKIIFILFLHSIQSFNFQVINKNYFNDDNSTDEPHSFLRDVQFAKNDTCLAVNFENVNDRQLPFYLHCASNYKFLMDTFTEDFVQVKFINLVNKTEEINATISMRKVQRNVNETDNELAHYELLINSTNYLSNFCWNLTFENDLYWYGAPANLQQHWPIDTRLQITERPYITTYDHKNSTGSLVEYVWFSSTGYLVFVERNVPLFIELDDDVLCLSAKNNAFPYVQPIKKSQQRAPFKAHIIISKNVKQAYLYYLTNFVKKPDYIPNSLIYSTNIWSTKTNHLNQQYLIDFLKNITYYGLNKNGSTFLIDKWETNYGSMEFDKDRFSDAKEMINEIKRLGFNISIWLTPFFEQQVVDQLDVEERDYMVKELNTRQNKKMNWSNKQNVSVLDPTNPRARRWFIKRIKKLLNKYNLDNFKLDAGEINHLINPFKLFLEEADLAPNKFSEYISLMIREFENSSSIELRTGFNSQNHGNLIRLPDRNLNWSYDNGIKNVIPSCLTYSIMGYPFIVSGLMFDDLIKNKKSDKELLIRHMALNSLLPVMQYSIETFDFNDSEMIRIGLKFQELHNQFVPLFIELSENAKRTGYPIIRPMWWISPNDKMTWTIDDQFLIDDNVIIAPILIANQTNRKIYLTDGIWMDKLRNVNLTGPILIDNYEIKLDEIAYFIRY